MDWINYKSAPFCSKHREELRQSPRTSFRAYFEDCLADDQISEDTKREIRDWIERNPNSMIEF